MQLAGGVREGDILAGKYRVERVLGAGGMGVVVAAHHLQLDEKVAIKFLLPEMLVHPEAVGRFAREARAAVKIKSEHVARILDVGTLQTGAPYMVMEFLDGEDLGAWLKRRGPLPVQQVVDFVLQACVAIAEAHALGIIHRDLKPSNFFCVRGADGRLVVKVLDFGISKMTSMANAAPEQLTQTSTMMGSLFYMSQEQMRSPRGVDARADLWAIGVVLYELLTQNVPFQGETQAEVCVKIATEEPQPLESVRSDVPPGLRIVIRRCLEKDREKRYRNVAEMATALLPYAPNHSRATVDRIEGIIQAAERSSARGGATATPVAGPTLSSETVSAQGLGLSPQAPGSRRLTETSSPVATTVLATMRGKIKNAGIATAIAFVLATIFVALRFRTAAVVTPTDPLIATIADAATPSRPDSPPADSMSRAASASAPALGATPAAAAAVPISPGGLPAKPLRIPPKRAGASSFPASAEAPVPSPPGSPIAAPPQIFSAPTPSDPLQNLRIKN